MKKAYLLFILIFIPLGIFPQTVFSLNDYKQFLISHQNMSSTDLIQLHDAGMFTEGLNINTSNILYYDSICAKYSLTDYEKQLIQSHGFMASERLSFDAYGDALKDVFFKDLPVFVSTDAILHAVHESYDEILVQTEGEYLIQKIKDILTTLHSQVPVLDAQYNANPNMLQSLKYLDLYFGVGKKLLGISTTMFYASNTARADSIIGYINAYQPVLYSMFGETNHNIDFSQFQPRGHYADADNIQNYPDLPKYFQALMWLGRIEIYLMPPNYKVSTSDYTAQNSIILAALADKASKNTTAYASLQDFDNIIKLFVGETDNVSLFNLDDLLQTSGITDPAQLTDTLKIKAFQDSLITRPFAYQKINSQILAGDETQPDSIIPASAFMLMGQRFIIDSYVTAQVVYDRIKYNGTKITRMLPSTLDVLYSLGNDASAQLLKSELDQYHYGTNLASLRYLINGYDSTFWSSSLFNIWLNSIRQLNPPADRSNLPWFMSSGAWWQEKMNTQLGSWTELRHDNLLYAKESYTGTIMCSFPYSYVEPFPAFYKNLKLFGDKLNALIQSISFSNSYIQTAVSGYCSNLSTVCDKLSSISQKEIDNDTLSSDEISYLKGMLRYQTTQYGNPYDGWYYNLFYDAVNKFFVQNCIVADIHTSATDASGNPVGWVKHVGTGKINLGVFVVKYPNDASIAYVGPLYSYYDYTTSNFLRLTDDQWLNTYQALSMRPDWVNLYLADAQGSSKGTGTNLVSVMQPTPVGLTSFTAEIYKSDEIQLSWSTATEVNSQKFEIDRSSDKKNWMVLGSVNAAGNSSKQVHYSYIDNSGLTQGVYYYRLKQYDNNGATKEFNIAEVNYDNIPASFELKQNYPNPFNPSTVIGFSVPGNQTNSDVEIKIYDIEGRVVKDLVSSKLPAGNYLLNWEGTNDLGTKVVSGVYFCRGKIGTKTIVIKMIMLK